MRTRPRFHQDKHSDQSSGQLSKKCGRLSDHKVYFDDRRETLDDHKSSI